MTKVIKFGKKLNAPLISLWYSMPLAFLRHMNEKIGLPRDQISLSGRKLHSGKAESQFQTKKKPSREAGSFKSFHYGQDARLWDTTFRGDFRGPRVT